MMSFFFLALSLYVFLATVTQLSASEDDWCYNGCEHTPSHWSDMASGVLCGGHRQSPINIVSSHANIDHKLLNFSFTNFSDQHALKMLVNNGHTVKCEVVAGQVEVSGGGLNGSYGVLQFHLHWGDTMLHPGSEHLLDGYRYPMEMHIVCIKKDLNTTQAVMDPEGLAVLAFFIEAGGEEPQKPWQDLTSYLNNLTTPDSKVNISHHLSISDLLGNVDRTKFYRYMGSLTTPGCNEAVVWTVFQQPIHVHASLINLFPMKTLLTNVYREPQDLHSRKVYASPSDSSGQEPGWCYDDHCDIGPQHWSSLPGAFCGEAQQSPVDIVLKDVEEDPELDQPFSFTNFDDTKAMDYIINTGHTVKCVLKKGVEVSGGGLGHKYSALQFHFHWGDESDHPKGSEHTVDSVKYPIEMHIVTKRNDLTLEAALNTTNGLAVLAFFMEAVDEKSGGTESEHGTSDTSPAPDFWAMFTSYLPDVAVIGSRSDIHKSMSLDNLLGDFDRSFYRYNGSLTTPTCNPAVVWTVFREPIRMDKKMFAAFPNALGYQNVFRPTQPLAKRTIFTPSSSSPCSTPAPGWNALLFLLFLLLLGPLSAST